jgi:pSer/pThr/pTyr-binding forkhead associated (FHA) protein
VTVASVAISEVLLILKIAFLVLLYLFIWRIVRAAAREVRTPQESMILTPQQAAVLTGPRPDPVVVAPPSAGRLVVAASPSLRAGESWDVDSHPVTAGRGGQNDIALPGDDFASAQHARFVARGDEVWVEDAGSTNGTFVNGIRVARERRLAHGDVVRVGETELRFER